MTRYSVHPAYKIFLRVYEFLSFEKHQSKKFSGKYRRIHLKLLQKKKAIEKTADAIDDLAGKEIAEKVTKLSNTPLQNNSETVVSKIKMS